MRKQKTFNHEHGGVYVVDKKTGKPVKQTEQKDVTHDSSK